MNKSILKISGTFIILLSLLVMGCGETSKVRPHEHKAGDLYCKYEVTAKTGGGAIPIGSKICIYCEDPAFNASCDKSFTMEVAKGMTYKLKKLSNSCEECDQEIINKGWVYEYVK